MRETKANPSTSNELITWRHLERLFQVLIRPSNDDLFYFILFLGPHGFSIQYHHGFGLEDDISTWRIDRFTIPIQPTGQRVSRFIEITVGPLFYERLWRRNVVIEYRADSFFIEKRGIDSAQQVRSTMCNCRSLLSFFKRFSSGGFERRIDKRMLDFIGDEIFYQRD